MSDKITELTSLPAATSADLLAIVQSSVGVTKKITVGNLFTSARVPVAATSAEVDTGTNNTKFVTPLGFASLRATSADVNTGTNTKKFITPKGLADSNYALLSEIPAAATSAEVVAGTVEDEYVSPKTLADAGVTTVGDATSAVAGKIRTAITSGVNVGDGVDRAVTPKALADSVFGQKNIAIQVLAGDGDVTSGDGQAYVRVPPALSGMNIIGVYGNLVGPSTTGFVAVQIARGRQTGAASANFTYSDVLSASRKLRIDEDEYDSSDSVSAVIINTANDDLQPGDMLRVDIDTAGGGALGLNVNIVCQLP